MSDGINAIIITITIFILVGLISVTINVSKIRNNWEEYKCSPIFIPFSKVFSDKSASETFNVCISNYVKNFMDIFIQPFMNMFDMFITYGEIIFSFIENFKSLANNYNINLANFKDYYRQIIATVTDVIEAVMYGINESLNQIQTVIGAIEKAYMGLLDGTESIILNSNLGTLITNLDNLN